MSSTRRRAIMCVATVTLAAGTAMSGSVAHAATSDCGASCVEPYDQTYGTADILSVDAGAVQPGLDVTLAAAGPDSSEDFTIIKVGFVSDLYQDGLVGAAVDEAWPTDRAYQYAYSPDGVLSGFCLGLASAGSDYTAEFATLQPCGVNGNTIWITMSQDENDVGYQPWISGTDTNVATPYVLSDVTGRLGVRGGLNVELEVDPLSVVNGTIAPGQMWANGFGVLGG